MKNFDYLALDGHNLKTFLTVLDLQSVSKAAEQLDITQSTVSHTLDKLRTALGDPLFVRSGRQIMATEKARSLQQPVQEVLDSLKSLTRIRTFEPSTEPLEYAFAVNDFPRDLVFPKLLFELKKMGVIANFNFLSSGIPSGSLLRNNQCQFVITPFVPNGEDLYQTRLFEDDLVCFYDSDVRNAPKNKREFYDSRFIEVRFEDHRSDVKTISKTNILKLPKADVSVPNFNALAPFLKNTDMLCVAIRHMHRTALSSFSIAPLPVKSEKMNVYMVWHEREHNDPAHIWLRDKIKKTIAECLQLSSPSYLP